MVAFADNGYRLLSFLFFCLDLQNKERDIDQRKENGVGKDLGGFQLKFDNIESFLWMDGLGLFVWSSYFITLAVLTLNLLMPYLKKKRIKKRIREASEN